MAVYRVAGEIRESADEWVLCVLDQNGKVLVHPGVKKAFGANEILL